MVPGEEAAPPQPASAPAPPAAASAARKVRLLMPAVVPVT
jgi:hypothetical protein